MAMLGVRPEMIKMKPIEISAPMNAATINPAEPRKKPYSSDPIITKATMSFAPDEMPNTKGPAMGLLKKV